MAFDSLSPVQNQAVLYAKLQQEALGELTDALGEYEWQVDTDEGTLSFISKADPLMSITAGAEVIASIAPGPRSMIWGWAIPQGRPDGFAAQLRDYGARHGIAELTESEVPFPDAQPIFFPAEWVLETAHQVGAVATAITGHGPYFAAPIGGGSRAVLLLTLDPPLPQPALAAVTVALPRLLDEVPLSDARAAVSGLARLAGWTLEHIDAEDSTLALSDGTSRTIVRFDPHGRVTSIEGTSPAA